MALERLSKLILGLVMTTEEIATTITVNIVAMMAPINSL
jgi:hypothetical protein